MERWGYGRVSLPRLLFIDPMHQQMDQIINKVELFLERTSFWSVTSIVCRQRKHYPTPIRSGSLVKFGAPSTAGPVNGLRPFFQFHKFIVPHFASYVNTTGDVLCLCKLSKWFWSFEYVISNFIKSDYSCQLLPINPNESCTKMVCRCA